jgi:cysteine desulfurase
MTNLKNNQKIIYLDYAATTPLDPEIFKEMKVYFVDIFANPSSLHQLGQKALMAVDQSRELIKKLIEADYLTEIIFTSSATESNNLAIKGLVYYYYFQLKIKPHIISSEIEHPSIIHILKDLKSYQLADFDYLPLNKEGIVDYEKIKDLLKENTCLVTIHYVNSELGIKQPINFIAQTISKLNTKRDLKILFHTDASQAPLTEEISVKKLGVDLMTISGHKIYGPKGIAFLYKKQSVILEKILSGSEQEFDLRSGTENVPLIVGLAKALEKAVINMEKTNDYLTKLKNYFIEKLKKHHIKFEINGNLKYNSSKILNLYFPQKKSQELLLYLDQNNICVSAGMACQSRALYPSQILLKIYPQKAQNSLRFSFGREITYDDLDYVVEKLKKYLNLN